MLKIEHSNANGLLAMLNEAEIGMEAGKIYDTSNMQIIWRQHAMACGCIEISMDNGVTWQQPPSVDTGKWSYHYNDSGERNPWLFRKRCKKGEHDGI